MKLRLLTMVALCAGLALALGAAEARAVITVPIPADVGPTPPPTPALPAAGETPPPADAISDPVEPAAACGDWYLQSSYGDRWPAGSAWWEFSCSFQDPHCTGMCNANTSPDGYVDYFYWDGSRAVFYGEFFGAYYWSSYYGEPELFAEYWWDARTSQWYKLPPPVEPPANASPAASFAFACTVSSCDFDGSASSDSDGTIVIYEWVFGDGTAETGVATQHTYSQPGTYTVTLTVTDDAGGWNRESKTVTIDPPNDPPTSVFTAGCSGRSCAFDGRGSGDSDGTIVTYAWEFGDGTIGSGVAVQHTYAQGGNYTVTLTVTDDDGATSSSSQTVRLISLTAVGYKVRGFQQIDLSWSGPSGGFDVYRNGARIATVQANAYTDNVNNKGARSYVYTICAVATSICSNEATVSF
jgi:PKD repeat protein